MSMFLSLLTQDELTPQCYHCKAKMVITKTSFYPRIVYVRYICKECNNQYSKEFVVKQLYNRKWSKNA